MSHHNDRNVMIVIEVFEDIHHVLTGFGVQCSSRFVSHNYGWIHNDGACCGDPLFFSAGECGRFLLKKMLDPENFCQLFCAFLLNRSRRSR